MRRLHKPGDVDHFAIHREAEKLHTEELSRYFGPNWCVTTVTKKNAVALYERYGEDLTVVSPQRYAEVLGQFHRRMGCPPMCPNRLKGKC